MTSDDETDLMSKYLLKGATMLGEHCENCGNPIFKLKGERVCPVCTEKQQHQNQEKTRKTQQDTASPETESKTEAKDKSDGEVGRRKSKTRHREQNNVNKDRSSFSGSPDEKPNVEESSDRDAGTTTKTEHSDTDTEIAYQQQVKRNLWESAAKISDEIRRSEIPEVRKKKLETLDRTLSIIKKYSRE